jgi:hypothetical protein
MSLRRARLSPAVALVVVLASVLAVVAVSARAEDDGSELSARVRLLQDQVASLRADVELLRARDGVLTSAASRLADAGNGLRNGTAGTRGQGFEGAAIPQASRTALLSALDALARALGASTPAAPTPQEKELRRRADELRNVWTR